MSEETPEITLSNNKERHRYELKFGGQEALAILVYKESSNENGDTITLIHTEVPPELEGHGLGGNIAKYALDDAKERGLQVVASCPFVSVYVRRHPDYMSLLTEPERERLSKKD